MCFRGVYKASNVLLVEFFFRHQEETIHFYGGKLRIETSMSVESVGGIVICHLGLKKK